MKMMPHLKSLMDDLLTMSKGMIIKRTDIADRYETLDTIRNADYFILASTGQDSFETYIKYPMDVLISAGLSDIEITNALKSKENIAQDKRDLVLSIMRQKVIDGFVETNDYYRQLNGKPDIADAFEIKVTTAIAGVDNSTPIHLMTDDEIGILTDLGIIDELKAKYPTKRYLNFLGVNRIDIVEARQADRFTILRLGRITNSTNESMFRTNYELARRYIIYTHYMHKTFGHQEHYDAYIGLRILSEAITYCISQNTDILNKKTYTDIQTCKYILQSYGMDIFDDIPLRYRKAIADNIEILIKHKGTDLVFDLIYSIFGFDDIDVYKYYITKQVKRDELEQPIISSDPTQMYELKMVQVPITSKNVSLDVRNQDNTLNYDDIVASDPYWGVYESPEEIKNKLLAHQFNYFDSKYISINTAYDVTKMNFELNYVMSSLLAFKQYESNIKVDLVESTVMTPIFDAFVYLFALLSKQYGFDGNIPATMAGVASTYRFNFEASLPELQAIYNQFDSTTQKYMPISSIQINKPSASVGNGAQLLNYYFNNVNIYNTLTTAIKDAKTKDQYLLCKMLLEYYTTSKQTSAIYTKSDGQVATTYLDYLLDAQPRLYYAVVDSDVVDIPNIINTVLAQIEMVIHSTDLKYMFTRIPTNNDSIIQKYIANVINVFKSYTIDLHAMNMVYDIDDDVKNKFRLMDYHFTNYESYTNMGSRTYSDIAIYEYTSKSDSFRLRDEIEIQLLRGGVLYEYEF